MAYCIVQEKKDEAKNMNNTKSKWIYQEFEKKKKKVQKNKMSILHNEQIIDWFNDQNWQKQPQYPDIR